MKKGWGASWFPSQEWGGKGLGRLNMKHEKGFGRFMVHKSGVGRAWEGSKRSMKKELGTSWLKSGVGRVLEGSK